MPEEFKRMKQRRGNKVDLPMIAEDAEINITLDTEEIFYGVNGQHIKLLDEKSFVNTLINPSNKLPASVAQLAQVNNELEAFKLYVNNLALLLNQKQDIFIHKGLTPPTDTSLIWNDTN